MIFALSKYFYFKFKANTFVCVFFFEYVELFLSSFYYQIIVVTIKNITTSKYSSSNYNCLSFNTEKFPFKRIVLDHINNHTSCTILENLHQYISCPNRILSVCNDQNTEAHDLLYKLDLSYSKQNSVSFDKKKVGVFLQTYYNFIEYLESDVFHQKLIYQKLPTLRVHFPNNLSVGEYHRDSDYNHPKEEINIWLPLTSAYNTATLNIEKTYLSENYFPVELEYGQFFIFNSKLKHGNEINQENYTRISFDFRVIPKSQFKKEFENQKSISQKLKFGIDGYYLD